MKTKNFLFELGTEEIPAGYIGNAVQKLEESFIQQFNDLKLSYTQIKTYSTPRRMAVLVENLQCQQEDEIIEKVGPAKKIAMDENGQLTKPGLGFVQGAKASPEDVFIKESTKGEYIAVKIEVKGRSTEELLPEVITSCISKVVYPKSMRWGARSILFARPIRWIIALYGQEIIPLEYAGVNSSNISQGNRFHSIEYNVPITDAESYLQNLKQAWVIADREERKSMISKQMKDLFKNSPSQIQEDERLLEQVTDLIEYPTAVIASFDEKYLSLPEKIITSTLTQNQKYFAVLDSNQKLSQQFVFISNGNPEHSEIIRIGNEKVVRARLEDAEFYYNEDRKKKLDSFVAKLDTVVFQAKLGTLLEKTHRIEQLVTYLCDHMNLDTDIKEKTLRAAHLCKADLVTLMLGEKEFTKLQGYIGMKYAIESQEDQSVAQAIYEHYMPRGQNDGLPSTLISAILAIADKMDTVCGIIGVDLIPTGSNDPFALRRAANGVVQIIEAFDFNVDLVELINYSLDLLKEKLSEDRHNQEILLDFYKQRMRWLMEQQDFEFDLIESMNHLSWANLSDIKCRLKDLKSFKNHPEVNKLILGFKRVSNIIEKSKDTDTVVTSLLKEKAEQELYHQYLGLKEKFESLLIDKDYQQIFTALIPFSTYIDQFFDQVLVNCEEMEIKKNRYALLREIRALFLQIADISKIQIENE